MSHFKGKEALEHIFEARLKGKTASAEIHGTEVAGHVSAGIDAAKESSLLFLLLWIFTQGELHGLFVPFLSGWLVWKVGRSACLGWARLERLHRLIEEERYEIEHHRSEEKIELRALYQAKGFSGKLLDEVVEVLMADDNRLLEVMLQDELGLQLETYEHPLKQAMGAGFGVLAATLLLYLGQLCWPTVGLFSMAAILISFSAGAMAKLEKNRSLPAIIWNLSIAILAAGTSYFLSFQLSMFR